MNLPNGTDSMTFSELFGEDCKPDEDGYVKVNYQVLMCVMADLSWADGKLEGIKQAREWIIEIEGL